MAVKAMEPIVYFTYTCPVSRKTYAGHPRNGYLYTHDNDLEEALLTIHSIARSHNQPVSWVINDQEYTDQEGLLHYFQKWQNEGDAVLVTMELTTDPAGVDKYDTAQVVRWIDARCKEAGLRIDGLWSLKFLESDLAALASLGRDDYPWTRNLAGSCWHQYGIDDSTWGGCSYMPYYASLTNTCGVAQPDEPGEFLMLEWLSRDPNAIIHGGGAAVYTLDPGDTNRAGDGGFDNEPDALRYSNLLISELAAQKELNDTVVVHVNEEARHFQTEGHDKAYMLDGMFGHAGEISPAVMRISYRDLWHLFRKRHTITPERFIVWRNIDYRKKLGCAALYEDRSVQMGFLQEKGSFPVEYFDYRRKTPGNDSNEPYPMSVLPELAMIDRKDADGKVELTVHSSADVADCGIMLWDLGTGTDAGVVRSSDQVKHWRSGLYGHFLIIADLKQGENHLRLEIQPVK